MTISATANRISFTGAGTTGPFAYPYTLLAQGDLVVLSVNDATGVATQLVLNTGYTLTGTADSVGRYVSGVNITTAAAVAVGTTLVTYGDPAATQGLDLVENDPLPAEEVEKALDRATLLARRLADRLDRILRQPDGDSVNIGAIPTKISRASKYLGFDADGEPYAYDPASGLVTSSANVTFLQAGTGAVSRTAQAKMRDFVSAADFGMLPTATAAANKTALVAAIAYLSTNGGEIHVPAGYYSVAPGIAIANENITISGAGSGMAYEGSSAGTKIVFTAGAIGFDLTSVVSGGNYTCLRNMTIEGNGLCATGVKVVGQALLEHLNVAGCTFAGIWLYNLVNSTRLAHVSCVGNTGYGLLVGDQGGSTSLNTTFSIDHFVSRSNLVGVRIEQASHMSMRDAVIESNTHEGMEIYRTNAGNLNNLTFDNVHVEGNYSGVAGKYNVTIDSTTHNFTTGPAIDVVFRNCRFAGDATVGSVKVTSLIRGLFINCTADGAMVWTTYATAVGAYNWNGGVTATITDTGNRCWQGHDGRGTGELGGPQFTSLNVGALQVGGSTTNVSCVSGAATTVYAMTNSATIVYYQVFVRLAGGTSSANNYSAYALIACDSTTKILHQVNGALLTITLSGLNIQATQSSGSTADVQVAVTRVFPES